MQKKILGLILSIILITEIVVPVWATTISGVRNEQSHTQQELNEVTKQIEDIQSQRENANTELENMEAQLVDILTSIEILEEEIELKQKEIDIAQSDLVTAQEEEKVQYENMKKRIQFMYEQGDTVYMQTLFGAVNYSDMVNKAEYVEQLFNYDRKMLEEFVNNREKIEELKLTLEDEQSQMRTAEYELEGEKENLAVLVAIQRKTVQDFDTKLEDAQKQASEYKAKLKRQTEKIKQLEEEKRKEEEKRREEEKKKEEERKNQEESSNTDESASAEISTEDEPAENNDFSAGAGTQISTGGGTKLGKQICDYAGQFVGNPYVYGGTSLTNGADCSGFTQAVFAHFDISIPRDSFSQRSCGVGVSYEEAQPGDLICYAGHVALYIGDGQIIHASTERTGITYGYATYRTILAVRRVI